MGSLSTMYNSQPMGPSAGNDGPVDTSLLSGTEARTATVPKPIKIQAMSVQIADAFVCLLVLPTSP